MFNTFFTDILFMFQKLHLCINPYFRYIDIRSIDPCDKEHKGVKARAGTQTPRPGKKTKDSMYKEE